MNTISKTLLSAALLAASLLTGCDEGPSDLTPEEIEALTDLELLPAEDLIDPDAPEPDDEGPVGSSGAAADLQALPDVQGMNYLEVISGATQCIPGQNHCAPGERCDVVDGTIGATLRMCVGPCSTDTDCGSGEVCGADGYCDVLRNGDWDLCVNGGCGRGNGDCDFSTDCIGSLECPENNGAEWHLPAHLDVCDYPVGHGSYCTSARPCKAGEGDCDTDAQCVYPNKCRQDYGAAFGLPSWVDVCLP